MAVAYASPKEANRHPVVALLYTCFVNVSSVGLVTVRSHFMHLVSTLLGVILSSQRSISADLVFFVYYFSVFNELVEVVNIDEAIAPWRCKMRIRTDERTDMFYKALCTLMHRM